MEVTDESAGLLADTLSEHTDRVQVGHRGVGRFECVTYRCELSSVSISGRLFEQALERRPAPRRQIALHVAQRSEVLVVQVRAQFGGDPPRVIVEPAVNAPTVGV